ncbi:uncharacterized protein PHACADRAFT_139485 [Phanerochaete carnosa HHB-10118-sp]|uniref:methionyl-tRNA formyltransferase n=1 Tax=Phanerochaete carnosa (strain HHB-10118-sp) TaxID=650164 RepID=K5X553_PHACS|nr:uncharacterized protein PHACADRAFT_139485 [Phanerochaete carnosa HHB-10118-sp]EKM57977.1 hypothetical protein PHACADRAFT_139485 [Phanerochaete carnosa HHB-10118-sp]
MLIGAFRRYPRICARLVLRRPLSQSASTIQAERPGRPFDILFFGRDEFSCMVLQQLYEARDVWQEIHIATQPNMKTGRNGSVLSVSPLKTVGQELGLPVHEIPPDKPSFRTWQVSSPPPPFSELPPPSPRLLVTASFGRILSTDLLQRFAPGRRLNIHPSLLPMYRGPAPIQHALLNGKRETGVCVIEMTEAKAGIDSGDIWGRERMPIPEEADFPALRSFLAIQGGELLISVLREMIQGTAVARHQPADFSAPRAPMITADDALIHFSTMTSQDIVRRHRAISHQKPLFAYTKTGKTVQLHSLSVYELPPGSLLWRLAEPGMGWYDPRTDALAIRCAGETLLVVSELKKQDRTLIPAKAWWNGIRPGMTAEGGDGQTVLHLVSQI